LEGKIDWPHREMGKEERLKKKIGLTVSIFGFGELVFVVGAVLLVSVVQNNNLPAFTVYSTLVIK
jgi:hypothetical protein